MLVVGDDDRWPRLGLSNRGQVVRVSVVLPIVSTPSSNVGASVLRRPSTVYQGWQEV